ncbi:MAG: hypothetical protein AAF770_01860 [Bacteroidota bacterium]
MATAEEIKADFVPKRRAGKNEKERKQIASLLIKERARFLEGSFVNEKNYCLKRINARTAKTERLWIFFGIHTTNAVIGDRMTTRLLLRKVT